MWDHRLQQATVVLGFRHQAESGRALQTGDRDRCKKMRPVRIFGGECFDYFRDVLVGQLCFDFSQKNSEFYMSVVQMEAAGLLEISSPSASNVATEHRGGSLVRPSACFFGEHSEGKPPQFSRAEPLWMRGVAVCVIRVSSGNSPPPREDPKGVLGSLREDPKSGSRRYSAPTLLDGGGGWSVRKAPGAGGAEGDDGVRQHEVLVAVPETLGRHLQLHRRLPAPAGTPPTHPMLLDVPPPSLSRGAHPATQGREARPP